MTVLTFTGFPYHSILKKGRKRWDRLLAVTDLLVSGPYRKDLPSKAPLLGSANQELHFLTGRILPEHVAAMGHRDLVEYRIEPDGMVVMTGFPDDTLTRGGSIPA